MESKNQVHPNFPQTAVFKLRQHPTFLLSLIGEEKDGCLTCSLALYHLSTSARYEAKRMFLGDILLDTTLPLWNRMVVELKQCSLDHAIDRDEYTLTVLRRPVTFKRVQPGESAVEDLRKELQDANKMTMILIEDNDGLRSELNKAQIQLTALEREMVEIRKDVMLKAEFEAFKNSFLPTTTKSRQILGTQMYELYINAQVLVSETWQVTLRHRRGGNIYAEVTVSCCHAGGGIHGTYRNSHVWFNDYTHIEYLHDKQCNEHNAGGSWTYTRLSGEVDVHGDHSISFRIFKSAGTAGEYAAPVCCKVISNVPLEIL